MISPRWWDGCEREVIRTEPYKPIGLSKSVTRLHLECGHSQTATPSNNIKYQTSAICRECARERAGEAA